MAHSILTDLPPLKIAYTSQRPFHDGPVVAPIPENDPANIAYLLHGDYFSFLTLQKLSPSKLKEKLAPYDLIFVALDHRVLDIVAHIAAACGDRLVTYSEGNIADYQMHSPAGQATFLQIINQARINFLYWEKYQPFYRAITNRPVHYLPYPYFIEDAATYTVPFSHREKHVTLPSGLTGHTRNGLGSLAVARRLLNRGEIEQINCWLSADTFAEDAQAIQFFLYNTPAPKIPSRLRWQHWLRRSGIDYRFLLKAKKARKKNDVPPSPLLEKNGLALYRRRTWYHYLPEMAKTSLVIDMNSRETVGRNAQDCAAVGVPCVSTNRSDMQKRLFPDITIEDAWDVEQAITFCQHLLQDSTFYHATIQKAATELSQFSTAVFRRRFADALNLYPEVSQKQPDGTNNL